MPTDWVRQVVAGKVTIEKVFKRVVSEAEVSRTAARIKLMRNLPPGFVCVVYDQKTKKIERIEESRNGCLSLFIEQSDRTSVDRLTKALEFHAVDGCVSVYGGNFVQWWRLDSRCEVPDTEEARPSVEILREITEDLFETRDLQNKAIFNVNGYASDGYQKSTQQTETGIYGALGLRFAKQEAKKKFGVTACGESNRLPNFFASRRAIRWIIANLTGSGQAIRAHLVKQSGPTWVTST